MQFFFGHIVVKVKYIQNSSKFFTACLFWAFTTKSLIFF